MVRWSLCEGRLNIKKRKKQSVPGKMVVVVRWSFYGRSFWPGGTVPGIKNLVSLKISVS